MKLGMLLILSFALSWAQAQSDVSSKVIVNNVDADVQIEGLDKEHFKVVNGLGPETKINRTPNPAQIESYFKEAGLDKEVANLDQFDKDFLYRKATKYSIERLVKSYPEISEEKLKKLKALVQ